MDVDKTVAAHVGAAEDGPAAGEAVAASTARDAGDDQARDAPARRTTEVAKGAAAVQAREEEADGAAALRVSESAPSSLDAGAKAERGHASPSLAKPGEQAAGGLVKGRRDSQPGTSNGNGASRTRHAVASRATAGTAATSFASPRPLAKSRAAEAPRDASTASPVPKRARLGPGKPLPRRL